MKKEDLKELGLTEEQIKAVFAENGKDIAAAKKDTEKLSGDLANWKKRAEEAEGTLKGFEGKDFDAIQQERDDWKEKAEQAAKDYEKQLHDRDYADLISAHVADVKFTSESAKKAYIADLKAAELTMKDGAIFGLTDFKAMYEKNDPSAFVNAEQEQLDANKAKPASLPLNPSGQKKKLSILELMKLKNANPDIDITQYISKGE